MKIALKIVGIIGLLFWTACCFLGMYFASDGKLVIAIPVTLLIAVALFLSYLILLKLQDKSATQGNRDRAKVTSIIMLCVYGVAAVFSAYYINHLVKTYENKDAIQNTAAAAIDELNVTFDPDGTDNSYRDWVSTELRAYKRNVRANMQNITADTTLLWTKFNGSLLDNGYKNLEDVVNQSTAQINASAVEAWWLPTLLTRLKELQRKSEWENEAVEYSKGHEYTKDDPFVPVSQIDCSTLSEPLTHDNFKLSVPAIFIMLALQVIILLGYLLGLKTGGKNDKIVTDDHGSTRSWSSGK